MTAVMLKPSMWNGGHAHQGQGVMLHHGQSWDALLRVWADGRSLDYQLDRWD